MNTLNTINDFLWGYILVVIILACGAWFTITTKGVQFRMVREMCKLLFMQGGKNEAGKISSFQAFSISIASRVGTGNLAGVATAIVIGGPGAIFWMWVVAILGASNAFIESTLAQLFKIKGDKAFIGGPAYYISKGLHSRWLALTFVAFIVIDFGFMNNAVHSSTICAALSSAMQVDVIYICIPLVATTMIIISGGVKRIAKFSQYVVPFMALAYLIIALVVIALRFDQIPYVMHLIFANAFGYEQAFGGGMGMAIMMGVKRGLFSNEAGMGSAPNAAATASVSHPVKQGLIQTIAVYTDTLLVCSCTAFIILCSGIFDNGLNGIELTQAALNNEIGSIGTYFIAIIIFFFAFTSIIANYYYGESNLYFITKNKTVLFIYRILVGALVAFGAFAQLELTWAIMDLSMALMALCNLVAIVPLGKYAIICLNDYRRQLKEGKDPVYKSSTIPSIANETECWH